MSNFIRETSIGLQVLQSEDILMTESRRLFLTTEIDPKTCDELLKNLMLLNHVNPHKDITLFINSPGGDVYSGLAIFDYINIMPCKLITVVCGQVASMGSLLFLAGDERYCMEHSSLMIHGPSFGGGSLCGLKVNELEKRAKDLRRVLDETATLIANATGKPKKSVLKLLDQGEDIYYNSVSAIENNLATGMYNSY